VRTPHRSISGHGKFDDAGHAITVLCCVERVLRGRRAYAWASGSRSEETTRSWPHGLLLLNVRYLPPPSLTAHSLLFVGHITHLILNRNIDAHDQPIENDPGYDTLDLANIYTLERVIKDFEIVISHTTRLDEEPLLPFLFL
jgi:hypothetical protein